MPFMPDPESPPAPPPPPPPPPASVKWSRVRELRASLKPSRRVRSPLPSPSVYDGYDGELGTTTTVVGAAKPKIVDVEETKRKTLFQRALEGWWDLPGLLSRGDTVRGKPRPFLTGKERGLVDGGFV